MLENDHFLISNRKILDAPSISKVIYDPHGIGNANGYLADPSIPWCKDGIEIKAYEIYRELIESTLGYPIIIAIDLADSYTEKLRALLLAAVYGRVSVLIRNVTSTEEIDLSLKLFHKVFCELEAENKEFNGYVKIGILVDTPCLLLQNLTSIDRIDFFTVNVERLISLMCGGKKDISAEAIEVIGKYISSFCKIHNKKNINARVGEHSVCESLIKIYTENSLSDLFCEENTHNILTKLNL